MEDIQEINEIFENENVDAEKLQDKQFLDDSFGTNLEFSRLIQNIGDHNDLITEDVQDLVSTNQLLKHLQQNPQNFILNQHSNLLNASIEAVQNDTQQSGSQSQSKNQIISSLLDTDSLTDSVEKSKLEYSQDKLSQDQVNQLTKHFQKNFIIQK